MNIFLRELKNLRMSLLGWTIGLCACALIFLSIYPTFTNDVETSRAILANFPPAVQAAFGLSLDAFFSFFGFYSYILSFVTLIAAIQAMNLGLSLLTEENARKTMDFLLSKPVSRGKVFLSKFAAAWVILTCTTVMFGVFTFLAAHIFEPQDIEVSLFVLLSLTTYVVQLWFLALGMLVSVLMRRLKSVLPVSLGVVFGFYIIGTLGEVIGDERVRYITPFKYFDYLDVIARQAYETRYLFLGGGIVIFALATACLIYLRRDIHSVS